MKKISISLIAIAAAFAMVSCKKEQIAESATGAAGNDVIIAYTESKDTKTILDGNDAEGYEVLWSKGDKFTIGKNIFTLIDGEGTTKGTFQGTLPEDGSYPVFYPETRIFENRWPEKYTYVENSIIGSPMHSNVTISDGKINEPISFLNSGGILRLTLKGTATIRRIDLYGEGRRSILCAGGVALDNTNGKVFFIPMPVMGEFSSGLTFHFITNDGLDIMKKSKFGHPIIIDRSKITDVSISGINSPVPHDILPGTFSVGENSHVHFSKGNLRYTIDSKKWSFFDKQYDCGPRYYKDGHDKEISLFTWGYANFSTDPSGSKGLDDVWDGNFDPHNDWGSQIGTWGTWRTLTAAEWNYLFKTRPDAEKKYGTATVCGIYGLIILPDEFEDPLTNGGNGSFKPQLTVAPTGNIYTSGGDWEAMEYAGAVFLPAAGGRRGTDTAFYGDYGFYWSSTAKKREKTSTPTPTDAYVLDLGGTSINPNAEIRRSAGLSVRLVSGAYTVNFDLNGKLGTAPQSIGGLMYGSTITMPTSPTAKGYVFVGWFKDAECKTQWNFNADQVYANTTLYAGWTGGVISGKFSVSDKKQVYFSMGNLWADASGDKASNPALHFEVDQYSYNSKYESSHVSHFTWNSSASGAVGTSGSTGNLFCDENHKVSVEGSAAIYYALSQDEWKYLFNGRTMKKYLQPRHTPNIRFCEKTGIAIYPDDYDGVVLIAGEDYTEDDFPKNCIFLPGAGWRDGKTVHQSGNWNGFYWSSSAQNNQPYHLEVVTDEVYFSEPGSAADALSIRLVADAY